MALCRNHSGEAQQMWHDLSSGWKGEDADAFYREFGSRIAENAQEFESACETLIGCSSQVSKELDMAFSSLYL